MTMSYDANQVAAENAERNERWDDAFYYWNECLSYVKRYDPDNSSKISYLEMKMKDCKSRAKG